ncbi:MAG: hypothetical protein J5I50_13775 [Chitinophagaceae bacterium]|nr:hypothetical protein [Chitinophagaceae bacterium]
MKKLLQIWIGVVVLCLVYVEAIAQEITDTRRKTESFNKLQPKDVRADVASFSFGGIVESAFANTLDKISPVLISKDSIVIEGDGVYAKVVLGPFDATKHKLLFEDESNTNLIKIDKRTYYGNYGRVPKIEIASVLLVVDGDTLDIPAAAYHDLYNLNFSYMNKGYELSADAVYRSKDRKRIYLYLFNKSRQGNYEVTWIFVDKKYLRRVLDYDFL